LPLEVDPDSPRRRPRSITFIGKLYHDAEVLAVADAFQSATDFHRQRPPIA
jgi:Asp-tRNA(Asn)/Glu-tRNA(Gln) amidotransferase A subunit family amidase